METIAQTAAISAAINAAHAKFFASQPRCVGSVLEVRRSLAFSSPRSSTNRQRIRFASDSATSLSAIAFSLACLKYQ